ncbi:hypothetical protein N7541_011930 [Penicillium brevicompactum]|uniref:Uncharacterized protein n=1 Tax=Penicillium brevicompactum TaxID=5074 RepID=A0A9W9QP47_PENBR|nr:uncharacterized protein N7506_008364 [Penicillium brevicompactum]KAJ5325262.1 hypothetical protein N7506_008364 [Penicillium brevicompactum]KAJ5339974.1 hypothetical protein N7452_006702 [Penicillium brevicompactum]KAJ5342806.1 hypothetical protein N7541_011930 [Penicillium brevicompactum]
MSQFTLGANKRYANPSGPTMMKPKGRVLIPLMATIGLGFAAYNYYTEAKLQQERSMLEEQERLAKNQQLMDAYGDKNSLHDIQQALDTYNVQ